ncbi:MAG: hypothetical protein KY468_03445 [Armatimonadetes bacterium]|nr:hypothetical protein [Armatimonadota bacterium]
MTFWTRRLIYLALALALAFPLITKWQVPPEVGPEARDLFLAVERVPPDKLILMNCQFEGSTLPENGPQARALMTHFMQSGKKFAIIGLDPIGPGLCQEMAEDLAKNFKQPYGTTWANLGYKTGGGAFLKGLARNIPRAIPNDFRGAPLAKLPVMQGIRSAKDVGMVIDVDPTATWLTWLAYFTGPFKVPYGIAPTAVMIADIYPFLNSGQVVGMLKGIAGAAQYERLVNAPGQGFLNRMPVFMAHLTIILLIILGNWSEIRRRREARA